MEERKKVKTLDITDFWDNYVMCAFNNDGHINLSKIELPFIKAFGFDCIEIFPSAVDNIDGLSSGAKFLYSILWAGAEEDGTIDTLTDADSLAYNLEKSPVAIKKWLKELEETECLKINSDGSFTLSYL